MRLDRVQSVCVGVLIGIGASYLLVCLDHIFAQTEPPPNWVPGIADGVQSLTLLQDCESVVTSEGGVASTHNPHSGVQCWQSLADNDHPAIVRLPRVNIAAHNELWMWARSDTPETTMSVQCVSWDSQSNEVSTTITSGWQLVRIPYTQLNADNPALSRVDYIKVSGVGIWLDDIYAVTFQEPAPESDPRVEPPPVDPPVEPPPVTYSKWSIQSVNATVTWSRVGSDGAVETQVIPVQLSIGAPQVTP